MLRIIFGIKLHFLRNELKETEELGETQTLLQNFASFLSFYNVLISDLGNINQRFGVQIYLRVHFRYFNMIPPDWCTLLEICTDAAQLFLSLIRLSSTSTSEYIGAVSVELEGEMKHFDFDNIDTDMIYRSTLCCIRCIAAM